MKKIISLLVTAALLLMACPMAMAATSTTLYVSSSGSDSNSGTSSSAPLATLSAAYNKMADTTEIILLTDGYTLTMPSKSYSGDLTIKGDTASRKITLPSELKLVGKLTLDDLAISNSEEVTIFAQGQKLVMDDGITSTACMEVYGGKDSGSVASTDITLLGGKYSYVFGGMKSGGTVRGDTHVVFGGTANSDYPISSYDDIASSNWRIVYGGGDGGGTVAGTAYVTIKDSARLYMVFGGGYNGSVRSTCVTLEGGYAMNVYGGSWNGGVVDGSNTEVILRGGRFEALFGGCYTTGMTGNTAVRLEGGEITRRVYSGGYNEVSTDNVWGSYNCVDGTTTLYISGGNLVSGKGLSMFNGDTVNMGIFSGSRLPVGGAADEEENVIVYLDDSYSTYSSKIGDSGDFYTELFESQEDYVVKCSTGGEVVNTGVKGSIKVVPDAGNVGVVNDTYYINELAAYTGATTNVTFTTTPDVATGDVESKDTIGEDDGSSVAYTQGFKGELTPYGNTVHGVKFTLNNGMKSVNRELYFTAGITGSSAVTFGVNVLNVPNDAAVTLVGNEFTPIYTALTDPIYTDSNTDEVKTYLYSTIFG